MAFLEIDVRHDEYSLSSAPCRSLLRGQCWLPLSVGDPLGEVLAEDDPLGEVVAEDDPYSLVDRQQQAPGPHPVPPGNL